MLEAGGTRMSERPNLASLHLRAFVVDDAEAMRALLCRLLKRIEISSSEYSEAHIALASIEKVMPDFILTDLSMEPMDGLTFARKIRQSQDPQVRGTPIILITGYAERQRVVEARDSGINEILVKPVTAEALYARIEDVILRPRNFVHVPSFSGPCRRRKPNPTHMGPFRRSTDPKG
jgi:CheY-like chemotaxis protein